MIIQMIRYFTFLYCSSYTYYKLLNIEISKLSQKILYNIIMLILSFFISNCFSSANINRTPLLIISYMLFMCIFTKNKFPTALATSIFSLAISFLSIIISSLLISIIVTPFCHNPQDSVINIYIVLLCFIQYLLIYSLFKIPRLKKGMPFLHRISYTNIGTIICILTLTYLLSLPTLTNTLYPIYLTSLLLFTILAIALLIWWRHKITQSYVEKLRVSEVETLYKEISDKDLEIEKLRANNEQLAGIIHKDNKLIPAMELAVRNYLQTATLMKPEDAKQMGTDLLAKLERMSEERTGIIRTYQEANSYRQRCGLTSIDAIVDYMENRAAELGIEYHYQYDKGIKEMLPAYISEDDAMHLLSDIIENALIASTHNEKKSVHIHIGFIQSTLFIDISDSGIPFAPETYQNLGMLQHTTHKEHGGSGIGLMDLGKLKQQYKFSLHIYEYPETEPVYTKKIRILFDKKNHYLIQSYRSGVIRAAITRNDLHIFQYTDTKIEISTLEDKSKRSV